MASSGPNSPSSASVSSETGSRTWGGLTNIYTENGSGASSSNPLALYSYYLKATSFGFAIPTDSTVDGIVVRVVRSSVPPDGLDSAVRIIKGGAISTTDFSTGSKWAGAYHSVSYGSPTSLWGESWIPSDINSSDFGFAVAARNTPFAKAGHTLSVDHIGITVYYTEGTGGSSNISKIGNVSYANVTNVSKVNKANISKIINIT